MSVSTWLFLTAAALTQTGSLQRFAKTEVHMGTQVEIVLFAPNEAAAQAGFQAAFARIAELEMVMSDYDSDSEVSRLSQGSPTPRPTAVSQDLFRVLAEAQRLSQRSAGAFDVTVGPLTKLWRRSRRQKELPRADLLAKALESVGYQYMRLHTEHSTVELLRPAMRIDLGAIGKGYACDEALTVLSELGLRQALVDFSGNIACGAAPPTATGWRVGIAPLEPAASPSRFLLLSHCGVATSGDTWQYVEIDGVRYSHILDPTTGMGLTRRGSVTVVAPNGMLADGLSTTVSVLGPERGLQLMEDSPKTAALIVQVVGDGLQTYASSRLTDYLETSADQSAKR